MPRTFAPHNRYLGDAMLTLLSGLAGACSDFLFLGFYFSFFPDDLDLPPPTPHNTRRVRVRSIDSDGYTTAPSKYCSTGRTYSGCASKSNEQHFLCRAKL
uniref:Uncharacterized protein n=1 Tax=Anopheles darlingi TaxID=43151 RepID=A0A2M4DD75_ANODA